MVVFPVFPAFSFIYLKAGFYYAALGSAVALTASSCIPVRVQPLRACVEPPAGVGLPRPRPPCIDNNIILFLDSTWQDITSDKQTG